MGNLRVEGAILYEGGRALIEEGEVYKSRRRYMKAGGGI